MKHSALKIYITITLGLLAVLQVFGQTTINGIVKTSAGRGVDFANVIASASDDPESIVASVFTDSDGHFRMSVTARCDSLILRAAAMGISTTTIVVANRTGSCEITVEEQAIELKEVVVKQKKIYSQGDTINYNVASFLSQSDQNVADVLRKMPGISVAESGQVSYQGKPIKNLYIEGLNLMKGHYGIATNNISPDNIATVQVFENHQDVKALKGLRPEERASINLRLKDGVKGVFGLIACLGGGNDGNALWNNSATATYFKRESQFLATYKGNNTGEDLSQELYSYDDDYARTGNILSVAMPGVPGIDKRFYYFNNSHSATFNNLYKIGTDGELGVNAAYFDDRDRRQSMSATSNFLPDGGCNTVDESMAATSRTRKAYGDFSYISNGDNDYIKEQLKFDWGAYNADSRITAANQDIVQTGKTDTYRLLNKFHMTHRNADGKGFELHSLINVEKRPHSLSVQPNLFPVFILGNRLTQRADLRNISAENSFSLLSAFKAGRISVHPSAILNYRNDALSSRLADFSNNLVLQHLDAGISTEISYSSRKVRASLYLPLKYRLFRLNNRLDDSRTAKRRLRAEPSFDLYYNINSSHKLILRSSFSYQSPSVEKLYQNYILTSYRSLSAYEGGGLFEGANWHSSVSYNFKSILSMSFACIELSWLRQSPDVLYGSYYDGIAERTISCRTSEQGNMLSAKLHGSQGFDWRRLKIGAAFAYSRYDNPLLVQNEVIRYTGKAITLSADISLAPFRWLSASYQGSYSQTAARQQGFDRMPWLRTVVNKASLDFAMPRGLTFTAELYHYYNNFNDGDRSFILLGAEAKYSIQRVTIVLACDNLLNRRSYVYSNISALTESESAYAIRPRSVLLKLRFKIL